MAINYTTLFDRLGKFVKYFNLWQAYQGTTLLGTSSGFYDIDQFFTSRQDLVQNMYIQFASFASTVAGWESQLQQFVNNTLADLQSALNTAASDPNTILNALYVDMIANSQTIQSTTITSPSSSAGGTNVGNGVLVLSDINAAGVVDQRIINETIKLICTADAFTGATSGGEVFSITGLPIQNVFSYLPLGNGNGPNLTVSDANNILNNGNFESFTVANTPDSWTIVAGTVGTNIKENTANPHRGSACLSFDGDGTTTTVEISQDFTASVGVQTIYSVGVWLRKSGTVTSGSTLQVAVKGTGFSTVNLFNADPSTLTTAYQFFNAQIITLENAPIDSMIVDIKWTSANTAGASAVILIDDCVLIQPVNFGNVSYSLFAGATDFLRADFYTVTTAVSFAAVFQTFFTRYYGIYLPNSGSPSIADSLAT